MLKGIVDVAYLVGPRMYYSIFGIKGVLLGAEARLLRKPMEVRIGHPSLRYPVHLRLRTTDVALCREILVRGQYECSLARPPRVIVDAGANIGLASVFYANKYPGATIVAVEPEPSNYLMLQKNTARYPNIMTVQAALWNRDTDVDIVDLHSGHLAFQTRERGTSTNRNVVSTVAALTMDRLMAKFSITAVDLLKVDIEGAEKELFETDARWLSRVGVIAVELHDSIRPGVSASVEAAAKPFAVSWRCGEVTYWAREGLLSASLHKMPSADLILPLRILDARRGLLSYPAMV